jgi:hypothetical protein
VYTGWLSMKWIQMTPEPGSVRPPTSMANRGAHVNSRLLVSHEMHQQLNNWISWFVSLNENYNTLQHVFSQGVWLWKLWAFLL